jgi:hypothetical protein
MVRQRAESYVECARAFKQLLASSMEMEEVAYDKNQLHVAEICAGARR